MFTDITAADLRGLDPYTLAIYLVFLVVTSALQRRKKRLRGNGRRGGRERRTRRPPLDR